jgi:ParB family chromosome partitioning protein
MQDNNKPEWMKRVKQSMEDFDNENTDRNNFIDDKPVLEEGIDTSVRFIETEKLKDAPKEWNRFKPLTYDKFQSLKDTIEEEGLMHPIYVWKHKDDYIIISGHNRRRAYEELYEKTKNKKYKKISATIEIVDKIDEDRARSLVGIGNIQRAINANEQYLILKDFYEINRGKYENRKEAYKKMGEEIGKSTSMIYKIMSLENVIPQLREMIGGNNPISLNSSLKIVPFTKIQQEWLYVNFKDELTTKSVKNLSANMKRDEIREYFDEFSKRNTVRKQRLSVTLPKEVTEDIEELIKERLKKWEEENNIKWKL